MSYQQEIEPNALIPVLESLSEEMLLRDVPETELVIIGGAAMNLGGYHHRATIDVDVMGVLKNLEPIGEPQLIAEFPERLQDCVRRIAEDFDLMENWLNFGPASLTGTLPEGFLQRANYNSFGEKLSIHVASRFDLIYLKLHAVVNTAGTDRGVVHREDLRKLAPDSNELKRAIRWSHDMYRAIDDDWDWDNSHLRNEYQNVFEEIANTKLSSEFFSGKG